VQARIGEHYGVCFREVVATCDLLGLLLPESAENPSLNHDLPACQDRPSPLAMRLYNKHERLVALGMVLGEPYMVQSKMCGVKADLVQTAFGTPNVFATPG
jgi:hypothetical protein